MVNRPIIVTKFHRPPVTEQTLRRDRLHRLLNRGLQTPFTLVSAPAGYGKSTLVSDWAETLEVPAAWLSLDKGDSDLHTFLIYLIEAIRQIEPGALAKSRGLITSPSPPPVSVLGGYIINEIDELGHTLVLVLDDYHQISALSEVHDLVRFLLDHPPQHLHLVLVTRNDPPLPLVSLRGGQGMSEVRLGDLEFSAAEVTGFLDKVADLQVSEASVANLLSQTEGWAVGLQLVALHLSHIEDPGTFLMELQGGIAWTQEFMLKEVLADQAPVLQEYLLRASLFDRFCAGLIDAVGLPPGSDPKGILFGHQFMEMLSTGNLFTVALDAQGQWYRYHHLFQDLLQRQLKQVKNAEEIAELHLKASGWFQDQELFSEAIEHALLAGEPEQAADIVAHQRSGELTADRWRVVAGWQALLPDNVRQSRPDLLLTEAWTAYYRIQVDRAVNLATQAEVLIQDKTIDSDLQAEILFFQGYGKYWEGDPVGSQEILESALTLLNGQESFCASEIQIHLGLARAMDGKKDLAVRALDKVIQSSTTMEGLYLPHLHAGLSFLHLVGGDLFQCRPNSQRLIQASRDNDSFNSEAWGLYLKACTFLHAGELEEASTHFDQTAQHRYILDAPASVDALAGLALAQQMRQLPGEATKTLDLMESFAQEANCPTCMAAAESSRMRLAVLRGDLNEAIAWAQSSGSIPTLPELFLWLEVPAITRARVMIASGTEVCLKKASALLKDIRRESKKYRFTGQTIEVMTLEAVALDQQGQSEDALEILEEVLTLAEPLGWVRPFIEAGGVMSRMLLRLAERVDDPAFIKRLLATGYPSKGDVARASATVQTFQSGQLLDELTNRELDVLGLLAKRFQNQEIADQLCISAHTVNFHLKQVYQKLDVHSRRQAVDRALELGILDLRPPG